MKTIAFSIAVTLLFLSCELVVDVDIPKGERALVLNCTYNSRDSTWSARVSSDRYILDDSPFTYFEDAIVEIREEGSDEVLTLQYTEPEDGLSTQIPRYILKRPARLNTRYTIEARKDGFAPVRSSMHIPEPVAIQEVKFDTVKTDFWGPEEIWVSLTFSDPPGSHYYGVQAFAETPKESVSTVDTTIILSTHENPLWLDTDDPIVDEFNREEHILIFNDKAFENKEYTFVFTMRQHYDDNILAVKIVLLSLNQEYYKYNTTLNLQHWNDGNPFAEPVNVYNNIENGFGIFAGYSSDEVEYKYGE